MDIERVFMSCYKIEEQPDDIFNLIELALRVGAFKYQPQFEKRKARIIKFLMNPSITSTDDDDDEEEEVIEDNVGDQDDVTSIEEPEKEEEDGLGTQQITAESNKPLVTKIRIVIRKSVQVAPAEKQNNCSAIKESSTELKKTDLVQQLDKQGTPQSHNTTTMPSRKRNESTKPPRLKQLLSDFSFEKQLDGDKQLQKQSHKGFKKMESDTEKKREEGAQQTPTQCRRKECTTGSTKNMPPPLMKMNVEVAPPPNPKQSNCSSSTRPMQKTSQSYAVARPMLKETQSDSDMKKKFESSKRKFEQRLADQREAKRRIVLVDFHQMPKAANDPPAPKRCWSRKRF
ncbi:hypothetical protein R3W88_002016 [Solanum pinnatisectum]|uniref:Uncharacterized protein n=1 Tax=Solanum pinnatisectum TaxID=50273 RepID=A0AAV9MMS3_9SOLN|nr:hypothetical protein R3W88_002016 [Solanum pinnatisectum]